LIFLSVSNYSKPNYVPFLFKDNRTVKTLHPQSDFYPGE
jgi:hypothetical protein